MKRFLVSRLSALGDVVCTLPAASALKNAYPDCHITWVADPRFAAVAECCEAVDLVVKAKPKFNRTTWPEFSTPFDVAFDMQGLLKSAVVVGRAKAGEKLGYWWQREGASMFSSPVTPDPSSIHIVDQYVDVARAAGGVSDRADFRLKPKDVDLESVRSKLAAQGVRGQLVVMNAGAGWITKRWSPEGYAEVAAELGRRGIDSVLIGGPAAADREAAEAVSSRATDARSLVGQTSVSELIALISIASAHVGGDTGSTHIAAALGIPAVGIYSITRPERSCPYGQIDRCVYNRDGLDRISSDQVTEKLEAALADA